MEKIIKPINKKNYGSIPHLSNSKLGIGDHYIGFGQEKILTEKTRDRYDEVFVFEKYDGSNVGIAKLNGKIFALTRSGYEAGTSPYVQHHKFNDWVQNRLPLFDHILNDGERITGEWLAQAHGIVYDIDRRLDPIVFFDFFDNNNKRKKYDLLQELYNIHGIQLARMLHRGAAVNVDILIKELNRKTYGIVPDSKPEGMVYRVERKGKVDFLAKWVRSDFEPGKYIINKNENEFIWNTPII